MPPESSAALTRDRHVESTGSASVPASASEPEAAPGASSGRPSTEPAPAPLDAPPAAAGKAPAAGSEHSVRPASVVSLSAASRPGLPEQGGGRASTPARAGSAAQPHALAAVARDGDPPMAAATDAQEPHPGRLPFPTHALLSRLRDCRHLLRASQRAPDRRERPRPRERGLGAPFGRRGPNHRRLSIGWRACPVARHGGGSDAARGRRRASRGACPHSHARWADSPKPTPCSPRSWVTTESSPSHTPSASRTRTAATPVASLRSARSFSGIPTAHGLARAFEAFTSLHTRVVEFTGAPLDVARPARLGAGFGRVLGTRRVVPEAGVTVRLNDGPTCEDAVVWASDPVRIRSLYELGRAYIADASPRPRSSWWFATTSSPASAGLAQCAPRRVRDAEPSADRAHHARASSAVNGATVHRLAEGTLGVAA